MSEPKQPAPGEPAPERAGEAVPEKVERAATMSNEDAAGVPVAVEASRVEAVVIPVAHARTAPMELEARPPGPPTDPAPTEATAAPTDEPAAPAVQAPPPVIVVEAEPPPPGEVAAAMAGAPEHSGPSPDFALAGEEPHVSAPAEPVPVPVPAVVPKPPILPTPAEAALEAARVVSQMVDIDSESGAVIAAAAAAGAAIEAAVAAQAAKVVHAAQQQQLQQAQAASGSGPNASTDPASSASAATAGAVTTPAPGGTAAAARTDVPPSLADLHAQTQDPVTTVRLSRDRILRALADEQLAAAAIADGTAPPSPAREPRARTEPGLEEEGPYGEFDPVAIAAAAIGRLRNRARTDLAELRVHYRRHDILVVLLAFVIIVIAGRIHATLVTPRDESFNERGLTFRHGAAWLRSEVPLPAPRLVRDPTGTIPSKDDTLDHVELSAVGSTGKIEVLIDKKPAWSNIVTGLELDRRTRWGELYKLDDSSVRSIAGHDWLRTAYRYAHTPEKGDVPRVDRAVELATIDREQSYVITLFGTAKEIEEIEDVVAPSLRVASQTGLPLVPQTSRLGQRTFPGPVHRAFESTVMVVVADLVDGRLRARGGGSGVIVGGDGSILTNYHVIHDKDGRLHDVFVIARFSAPDQAPQLQCAGRPNRSKLQRELDLALIKCDMDLDGRTWNPASSGIWATLTEARAVDIKMGQRLWVLGYPDVGGGGLTLSEGEVEGWTGEDGAQGRDFIKTDASITRGNSGGPVVDDQGRLVGIASAFRTKVTASGGVIETAQIGLVRPLQTASDLLAIAAAGWTPREGHTDVDLTPTALEASPEGIRIFTTVVDSANEQPVRDATVMVLKPGINASTIDMNRLDDQAIAWGKTNAQGEVRLKQLVPTPGTYTVVVIAPGYEPQIGDNALHLDAKTPPSFDPWDKIGLRSR